MNISDRIGGGGREGAGRNNTMSLWTWPWIESRRSLRPRQQLLRQQQQQHSTARKYAVLIAVLLFCLAMKEDSSYYNYNNLAMVEIEATTAAEAEAAKQTTFQNNESSNNKLSLAVLVAGSTQRFLFDSFVEHVALGSSKGGAVDIDYFAILTLKSGPAFRQDAGYMGHLVGRDKMFRGILDAGNNNNNNNKNKVADVERIQTKMMETMASALTKNNNNNNNSAGTRTNTNIRALRLLEEPIEDDPILDGVRVKEEKRFQTESSSSSSSFDLFRQFPMMDKRQKALTRTQAGNKNMIRLFLALESLWKTEFLQYEESNNNNNNNNNTHDHYYDYVLILRDDTLWLGDFDLRSVIATDPTADAYILSCDGRNPTMLPPEINDHGILIKRNKAAVVGEYVSAIASLDLRECHDSVVSYLGSERGCNSEMILRHVLETNRIKVKLVPQSLLPFERAVLVEGHNSNGKSNDDVNDDDDFYCYHKFCQSIDSPLQLPPEIQKCKELSFDA